MKTLKKIVSATVMTAMLFSTNTIQAANGGNSSNGGVGYEESRRAPSIAPAVALGTVALIAIIAVAIQNSNDHKH